MRESRLSGSVEGVMSNHDSYSDSSELACGRQALVVYSYQVYSGEGADNVT